MTKETKMAVQNRRNAMTKIAAVTGVVIWGKPLVEMVVLPAHALTTDATGTLTDDLPVNDVPSGDTPPGDTPPGDTPTDSTPSECSVEWDKSSYVFRTPNCSDFTVNVCNTGDKPGTCPVKYEIWYIAKGNPKNGSIVGTNEIPAIGLGCGTIDFFTQVTASGKYKVKVFQHPGHPGSGVLWSEDCAA